MDTCARAFRFVLRPVSRRGARLVRQRHCRSICDLGNSGRVRLFPLSCRRHARSGAHPALGGPRSIRVEGAFRRYRTGAAASLLGLLASPASREVRSSARRPDRDFCVYRLVGVPRWSRLEQHHGLWVMTSSPWFRRFAFAYGPAFAVLYVIVLVRDLALFTVYPSLGIVLLGTHHSADIVSPSIAFAIPAMYWYGCTEKRRSRRLLQLLELRADTRLRYMQQFTGASQAASL